MTHAFKAGKEEVYREAMAFIDAMPSREVFRGGGVVIVVEVFSSNTVLTACPLPFPIMRGAGGSMRFSRPTSVLKPVIADQGLRY